MRMHREGDLRILPSGRDHLVDCEPREGVAALTGEHIPALGLLLTLEALQAVDFVSLQVVDAIDAAL